ncbi:hypothetical protein OCU04_011287 [Sclerotinia nivalis]|uniref:Uncharacterized protein n=1 Tax=Sclerotinia nivalis TaxID=352851 RepID=A0A9X0ABH3_9HELO|nr:hypothetical protein OCU04_011287 [Sclerotinia nivalis]
MPEINKSIDPNEHHNQISTSPIPHTPDSSNPELLASVPATQRESDSPLYLQARLTSPTPQSYVSHTSRSSSQPSNPSPFPPQSHYPPRPHTHTPTPVSSPRDSSPKIPSPKEEFPFSSCAISSTQTPLNPSTQAQTQNSPETISFQLWAINIQEANSVQDCGFVEFRVEDLVDVSFEFLRKRVSERVERVVCGDREGEEKDEEDGKISEDDGEDDGEDGDEDGEEEGDEDGEEEEEQNKDIPFRGRTKLWTTARREVEVEITSTVPNYPFNPADESPRSRRRRMDSIRRPMRNNSENEISIDARSFGVRDVGSMRRRRSERERRKGWDFEIYEDVVERGGDESVEMRGISEMRGLWERGEGREQTVYRGENKENEGIGGNGVAVGVNGGDGGGSGEDEDGEEGEGTGENGVNEDGTSGESEDGEGNEDREENENIEENENSHGNEDTPEPQSNQPSISTEPRISTEPSISTETMEILQQNQTTISDPSNPPNPTPPRTPQNPSSQSSKAQECHLTSLSIHWNPFFIPTEYIDRSHSMRLLSSKRAPPPPLTFKGIVDDEVEIAGGDRGEGDRREEKEAEEKEEEQKEIKVTEITPGFPTREKFAEEGSWQSGEGNEDENENEEGIEELLRFLIQRGGRDELIAEYFLLRGD